MPTTQEVLGWNEMTMADVRANNGKVTQGSTFDIRLPAPPVP